MIETKRLLIRKYTAEDVPALHKILSDPVTMSFWPAPFSLEQTRGWIERSIKSYDEYGFGRMAVILKATGAVIGDCGIIFNYELKGKKENDLGYIIHNPYWGKGYGAEAAGAVMQYAFETLKLERIIANMAFDNIASARVAEKIGMKKEKEFYNPRNRNILTYLFSIKRNL